MITVLKSGYRLTQLEGKRQSFIASQRKCHLKIEGAEWIANYTKEFINLNRAT
jgi:hypothetical protein